MFITGLVCKETVMPAAINMSVKTPLNQKNVTGNWKLLHWMKLNENYFM